MASTVGFSLVRGEKTDTSASYRVMEQATLPVVYFSYGGERINRSFGYTSRMQDSLMRQALLPVEEDLAIHLSADTLGFDVSGISYEVRDITGERLIEEGSSDAPQEEGGRVEEDIFLQNLLDEGQEYLFSLCLSNDDREAYYYTRLCLEGSTDIGSGMDFVSMFHDETLSGGTGKKIATYIEPSAVSTNDSLSKVDIHSSLSQIMWADFQPYGETSKNIELCEINDSYQAYKVSYVIFSGTDMEKAYRTEEYYRLRIGAQRVYLLEYERNMEEIFEGERAVADGQTLTLGIRDEDVEYTSDETGQIAAFIQSGSLFLYDAGDSSVKKVFGFYDEDDTDVRDLNTSHYIRICGMDESGTLLFIVCGYMPRGAHEGRVGVGVYRYDSAQDLVKEDVFLPSDKPAEVLKEEVGDLYYLNNENELFIMAQNTLYSINMEEGTSESVLDDLEAFAVSEENDMLAYTKDYKTLNIFDLNTKETTAIEVEDGRFILPLSYMGEDLVYGEGEDIVKDAAGSDTRLMNKVTILDEELSERKSYNEDNVFVTGVYEEEGTLHLIRVKKTASGVKEADEDTIINYENTDTSTAQVGYYQDETLEKVIWLVMSKKAGDTLSYGACTLSENEEEGPLTLEGETGDERYFIYRKNMIEDSFTDISDAVIRSDEIAAVVADQKNEVVWSRNKDEETADTELYVKDYYADGMAKKDVKYILKGVTLDEVLYYTSEGYAVGAFEDGDIEMIQGYDSFNIHVREADGTTKTKGKEDSGKEYEKYGGVYFVFERGN